MRMESREGKGGASESETTTGFEALPEGCIAYILSLTTPRDVCRLALVSTIFRSASLSDAVWHRFVPSDYESIISRSASSSSSSSISSSSSSSSSSKKDLYFSLSRHAIIIDDGKKSFQLDRASGKKCYMLAARDLFIVWVDTPTYWNWTSMPESRFQEVAELLDVCWLEIRGKISTGMLSADTEYAVYLVYKMMNAKGFDHRPAEVSVGIHGGEDLSIKDVCLDPHVGERRRNFVGLDRPKERSDGWLEIEMGEFFNSSGEEEEVEMNVCEIKGDNWKRGLFIEGILIRPKEQN